MADQKTLIIAEAGVNHNGDLGMALDLVDKAAEAGADYVKFQTFKATKLASASAKKASYQTRTTDDAESQLAMLQRLELSVADHETIMARCAEKGVRFLSTPFDMDSLSLLTETFAMPEIKRRSRRRLACWPLPCAARERPEAAPISPRSCWTPPSGRCWRNA